MTKRHYTSHKHPHYYINPITGRVIKSDSKTFQKLKKRRFIIKKDACLYDLASAKKCLSSIISKYNGLVYPSSNFMNIPSTYHKRFKAKGFTKNKQKTHINGFIDKKGKFKKLNPEIPIPKHHITEVVSLEHHHPILHNKVETSEQATKEEHSEIKEQINNQPEINLSMLFNPIQNDIIPIHTSVPKEEHTNIINKVNEDLIPNELPPVKETTVAGLIMDTLNPMKILGFTNTENETKKLETPIVIETNKYTLPKELAKDYESSDYVIPSILDKDYESSDYAIPSILNKDYESSDYAIPSILNKDYESSDYAIPSELHKEIDTSSYDIPSEIETSEIETSEIETQTEEPKEIVTSRYQIPSILDKDYDTSSYILPDELANEIETELPKDDTPLELANEIETQTEEPKDYETSNYILPDHLNNDIDESSYEIPSELESETETSEIETQTEEPKEIVTSKYNIPSILDKDYETSSYELPNELKSEIETSEIETQTEEPKEIVTSSYQIPSELAKEYETSDYILSNDVEESSYAIPSELVKELDYILPDHLSNDVEESSYAIPSELAKDYETTDYAIPSELAKDYETTDYAIPSELAKDYETTDYAIPSELAKELDYILPDHLTQEIETNVTDQETQTETIPEQVKIVETSSYNLPDTIELLNEIPQLQISQEELSELPIVDKYEEEEFKENLVKICGENEQLDDNNNCYSCEYYHLVWDPELKKCKKVEKSKEELTLVVDKKNKIKGYMDTSQYPPRDYRRRFVYNYSTPYRDETLVKLNSVKNKLRKL